MNASIQCASGWLSGRRGGIIFGVAIALVLAAHSLTLSYSPLPWLDEVQILEMGRVRLGGGWPDASMIVPEQGGSACPLYYVGGLAQEVAYRLLGDSRGPRGLSLMGLALTTFLIQAVLKAKGVRTGVAYLVALLFMVDPLVTQNVRGARVDIWACALSLVSILLISRLGHEFNRRDSGVFFLVGALSALQFFVWATAILQLLLVGIECWRAADRRKWAYRSILDWMMFGCLGAVCVAGILLLPLIVNGESLADGFRNVFAGNPQKAFSANLAAMGGSIIKSPFLCIAGGVALACGWADWRYALCMVVGLLLLLTTWLYIHRFLQLLPILVLALGLAVDHRLGKQGFVRKAVIGWLCLGLLFGFGYSVFARNAVDRLTRNARCHRNLVSTLRDAIGSGGIAVYADSFQLYYAARELGWNQYRMRLGEWWMPGTASSVMAVIDWFVTESVTQAQLEELKGMGFAFVRTVEVPSSIHGRGYSLLKRLGRPIGYGPYQLFKRTETQAGREM